MSDPVLEPTSNDTSTAKIVYILYLVSIVIGITSIIGVVIAYVKKSESPAWLQTHYQFQIRTFWIGLLFGFIGVLTSFILIGFLILFFLVIWLIIRCIKGFQYLEKQQAHPNPGSWMF
uniref:DUF4870 family protein n=1 Tax=Ningiella ruwaisensis TaxID=2364274 RepID=UPI0010A0162F|nr:hypothetical protein [Ningiella ruwaisensis]